MKKPKRPKRGKYRNTKTGCIDPNNPVNGLPCMNFNKKSKRWEEQPCPVPVQLSYWGPRHDEFIAVFSQQGGVSADLTR